MSTSSSHEPTPWELIRKPLAVAAIPLALVAFKSCSNTVSGNSGEVAPAQFLCLSDMARGRGEPTVPDKYDTDNLAHVLDLSGTPEAKGTICFPVNAGVRVKTEKNNGVYVPDEWYKVRFKEVDEAIDKGQVFNKIDGGPVSPQTVHRLGDFASNWAIDFMGAPFTWVNAARAETLK